MHRALIEVMRYADVRPLYAFMALFVVPFYFATHRQAVMAIWHYLRRRHGFGLWRSAWLTWLNHYRFGQVVIDRFAMYAWAGSAHRRQRFRLEVVNNELFNELYRADEGFVIMSCHVGNYEMAGYSFNATEKPYNALVYGGEAKTVMDNRRRMFTPNNIRMIPVADDMSHIFAMNSALANGEIISIPADRVFGSPRTVECRLLGATVRLPLGPFALATQRGAKAIAIFVMKEATYRYTVYIRRLDTDTTPSKTGTGGSQKRKREEQTAALAQTFATELETILRKYPEQWYNYYEFWED